jgi:thiol:disulfide interchange protein DsbC
MQMSRLVHALAVMPVLAIAAVLPLVAPASAAAPAPAAAPTAATGAAQAPAPGTPAANVGPAAAIKKALESRFAGTKVVDVQPSPIPGLYEAFLGDRIVYADATGDHVIVGSIIDSRTQTDLTQARMDERGAIDFKTLPLDKAIKITKGSGAYKVAVFEDPDCPFCQRLEQELATINDTTVYVFLFPIDSLHPHASQHARQIWCSPDRAQAWTQWLVQHKPPANVTCKGDPVAELTKLGDQLHIDGTPTMFLSTGKRVAGAVPTDELKKLLLAEAQPAQSGQSAQSGQAAPSAPPGPSAPSAQPAQPVPPKH